MEVLPQNNSQNRHEVKNSYKMNIRFRIFSVLICGSFVLGDPDEILLTIKRLRKEINRLNTNPGLTVEEKEEIQKSEDYLVKLKNLTDENFDLLYENEGLNEYETELYEHEQKIEKLILKIRNLEQKKASEKCIKLIKEKNNEEAAFLFSSITDTKLIRWIINETYEENNFLTVVDKINSISLSFKILKIINKLNDKFKFKLLILQSLKRNVFDQLSSSEDEKIESLTIMDEIRSDITTPLVEKCTNYLKNGNDTEIEEITHIICDSQDFKFYKKIWTPIFSNRTINLEQIKNFDKEGQILILDSLFYEILKKGIKSETVRDLILIQNDIKKIINETNIDFKYFYNVRDIKSKLVNEFALAFLGQYYSLHETDLLSKMTFFADRDLFMDVIQKAVNLAYGKIKTVFIIKAISESSSLGQNILGYKAVFNTMLEKDHLYVSSMFRAMPVLIFNQFVKQTIQKSKSTTIDDNLRKILDDIHTGLVKYTKVGVYKDRPYTLEYFKERLNIKEYDASYIVEEMVGRFLEAQAIEDFYQQLQFYDDFEFITNMVLLDEKLKYYGIKNTNIYVFEVAERYKKFIQSDAYFTADSQFKMGWEVSINRLPKSVKNVVFEVNFMKNTLRGGEYLYSEGDEVSVSRKKRSKWTFEHAGGPGLYRIKNGGKYLHVDESDRKVFLASDIHNKTAKWKLIPDIKGIFIKNNFFNEYFYVGDKIDTKRRRADIFKGGNLPIGTHWIIENVLDFELK